MEVFVKGLSVLRRMSHANHALSRTSIIVSSKRSKWTADASSGRQTVFTLLDHKSRIPRNPYRGMLQVGWFRTTAGQLDSKQRHSNSFPPEFSQQPALKSPLRLIDRDGTNLGVLSVEESRVIAKEKGLQIQVVRPSTPNSPETICKLASKQDFIEDSKKKKEVNKKAKHSTKSKELTLKSSIAENDLLRKIATVQGFLSDEYRVKIFIRGRRESIAKLEPLTNIIIEKLQQHGRLDGKISIAENHARFSLVPVKQSVG